MRPGRNRGLWWGALLVNIPWTKAAKAAAGGLLLFVLLITVSRWWGDYKYASETAKLAAIASDVTSSTASSDKKPVKSDSKSAESKTKSDKKYVIVVRDRLNFRYEPNNLSKTHGVLRKDQKMVLIKKENGWYQVEDDKGVRGWVSASPEYTKLQ